MGLVWAIAESAIKLNECKFLFLEIMFVEQWVLCSIYDFHIKHSVKNQNSAIDT